ncbi:MAG: S1 RNA-binding domain-containing protein [Cytophagaceae bacterium]
MKRKIHSTTISFDGQTIIKLETGRISAEGEASVVVSSGGTVLLATVNVEEEPSFIGYKKLFIKYIDKTSNLDVQLNKNSEFRTSGEYYVSSCIEKTIATLIPKEYPCCVTVNITLLSSDFTFSHEVLACLAASSALSLSDIPFDGPVAFCKIHRVQEEDKFNADNNGVSSDYDFLVGGTFHNIILAEGYLIYNQEDELYDIISKAHKYIKLQCQAQKEFWIEAGGQSKKSYDQDKFKAFSEEVEKTVLPDVEHLCTTGLKVFERKKNYNRINKNLKKLLAGEHEFLKYEVGKDSILKILRNHIITSKKRLDGRGNKEIRELSYDLRFLPSFHGSSRVSMGDTEILSTATLRDPYKFTNRLQIKVNCIKSFLYKYPNYLKNDLEYIYPKAIKEILPTDFPFGLQITCDTLSEDGSWDPNTVIGMFLALVDLNIPLPYLISGVSAGMIKGTKGNAFLVDLLYEEEFLCDTVVKLLSVDKKKNYIRYFNRVKFLSRKTLNELLKTAKDGNEVLKSHMEGILNNHTVRAEIPKIQHYNLSCEEYLKAYNYRGKIILRLGGGNRIYFLKDKLQIILFNDNQKEFDKAKKILDNYIIQPKVGNIYSGIVTGILPNGVSIDFLPGKEGFLFLKEDVVNKTFNRKGGFRIGQRLKVRLLEIINNKSGKLEIV